MPLTEDVEEELRLILGELDSDEARKLMNSWEQGFVSDQASRYDKYGSEIYVSPKQWAILRKLVEKVNG